MVQILYVTLSIENLKTFAHCIIYMYSSNLQVKINCKASQLRQQVISILTLHGYNVRPIKKRHVVSTFANIKKLY